MAAGEKMKILGKYEKKGVKCLKIASFWVLKSQYFPERGGGIRSAHPPPLMIGFFYSMYSIKFLQQVYHRKKEKKIYFKI